MLQSKNLHGAFWGEAVTMAVFLLNWAPTRGIEGMTPYEAWHGKKPAVGFLRTFGCVAHVKVTTPHPKKLDACSWKGIFVGYEPGSKAYRVFDPVSTRVRVTRDVVFDESAQWDWTTEEHTGMEQYADGFTIEYLVPIDIEASPGAVASPISSSTTRAPSPAASLSPASPETTTNVEFVSPISDPGDALDADHDDDAPLRFRALDNILGDVDVPSLAERELAGEALYLTSAEEPRTFKEAEQDPR